MDQEAQPEFVSRVRDSYTRWESGELAFADALDRIAILAEEARAAKHIANLAYCEMIMGVMHGYRANLDVSVRSFERARALYEQVGNRLRTTQAMHNIAECYRMKGNFVMARQFFRASQDAAAAMNKVDLQASGMINEAAMLVSMDHPDGARQLYEKAMNLLKQMPEDHERRAPLMSEAFSGIAIAHLQMNETQHAWDCAREALKWAQQAKKPLMLGLAYRALGQVVTATLANLLPDHESSTEPFTPIKITQTSEMRAVSATALGETPSGDPDDYFRLSSEALQEIKAEGELARTTFEHAKSLAARGRGMTAARKFQQAMILFTRLGMADDAAKAAQAQMKVIASTTQSD